MRIDSPVMTNAIITGSFSGSFVGSGNFEGLEADSVEFANVLNKPTLISSSAQITITESQISDLDHYDDTDTKAKLNTEAVVSGSATDVRSFLNVEDGADVTDTTNVTAAGALMDTEVSSLSGIKTLTVPDSTTISSFGASLVDDADASAARTTLGVDVAGTDNSTDVTIAAGRDYITLSGQELTLGQVDISDDTNLAVSDTTGQTGINLTLSGDTISGVVSGLGTSDSPTFSGLTVSNNVTVNGDLTVLGDATELQVSSLNVEDINITIASGAADSSAANGAGITIDGANESLTWDHGNSRFTFSDDLNVGGNITLSGTVDGRDVAADGSKLDGIEASADVTDTANVTAAGALMDSEVTNLAQVKAFDSSDYATAAQGTTADAALARSGGQMTGNITFSGAQTVDGRDLSADGSKLDGIEASADVTDTANVTAAGALMDSELANLAAVKAINQGLTTTSDVQFDSLGIGTAAPGTTGVIRATNDIVAFYSSDERLKDNIEEIPNALDKVESIRGVHFDWNDKQEVYEGHDIGVIAQEVEKVLPEIVEDRDNGYKAVKYEKLTAVLIQAVKELSAKVKELENK